VIPVTADSDGVSKLYCGVGTYPKAVDQDHQELNLSIESGCVRRVLNVRRPCDGQIDRTIANTRSVLAKRLKRNVYQM
jgi:hypothetical protein